jgi:asparagine synthase (glutamine-hydrolysing)
MCGILGGINVKIDNELLNTIKHRGPDRQAIYDDDIHRVSLAHTRLSIVDLSDAGNQPMVSEDNNYVIVFNGEIYNHQELRTQLKFNRWKGHSDTETLLHLLIEKGPNCLSSLNGIFSFAFYNIGKGTLFLARDPYGVKPLYYSINGNELVFSSEIRPIQQIYHKRIDENVLRILLNLRYVPSPYTLYESIYKMRPGHYAEIDINNHEISVNPISYYSHCSNTMDISFDEAVEEYGRKLESAVKRQLMGDVDMGILLSGGIDSAIVGGIASRCYDRPMNAYTVGFDSKYNVNEIDLAAETAKHFGMNHHVVKIDVDTFFDTFTECCRIVEEPLATTSFIPMYYLSKIASKEVKVVLTGQGADEPLGGYGRYQEEILRSSCPAFIFKLVHALISMSGTKKEKLLRGSRSLSISDNLDRFLNVYNLFTHEEVVSLTGSDNTESRNLIEYYYNKLPNNISNVAKMMDLDLQMDLADDLLLYTDKITMNFALECRVPMLDLDLVSFLQSLPDKYKVTRGYTKIIHKAFAKKYLPEDIINRPKFGFQSPTDIWFREKSNLVNEILLSNNSPITNYLSKSGIEKVVKQHQAGYNREKQIFLMLSINEWLKQNN